VRILRAPAPGRRLRGGRGQALAELALIAPLLILLIAAIFQFAYVFETQMGITNALREAARRGAAATDPTAVWVQDQLCADGAACTAGLLPDNVPGFTGARLASLPTVDFCTYVVGATTNQRITVSATYNHPEFFPFAELAALAAGKPAGPAWTWQWSTSAEMRLEVPPDPPLGGSC
jgi:TadE-like protein